MGGPGVESLAPGGVPPAPNPQPLTPSGRETLAPINARVFSRALSKRKWASWRLHKTGSRSTTRRTTVSTVQVGDSAQFEPSLQRINTDIEKCGTETRRSTRPYDIDISSMNLRHHWNASSRISTADVSDLPSVIHSSEACAV